MRCIVRCTTPASSRAWTNAIDADDDVQRQRRAEDRVEAA